MTERELVNLITIDCYASSLAIFRTVERLGTFNTLHEKREKPDDARSPDLRTPCLNYDHNLCLFIFFENRMLYSVRDRF